MPKVAVVVLAGTETHEGLARVVNAMVTTKELKEAGDQVRLVFDGAGTAWVGDKGGGASASGPSRPASAIDSESVVLAADLELRPMAPGPDRGLERHRRGRAGRYLAPPRPSSRARRAARKEARDELGRLHPGRAGA